MRINLFIVIGFKQMQNPHDFFNNMDYEEKIIFSCKNGVASSFAYGQLLENLKAASIQMDRIWSYAKTIKKSPEPDPNEPNFQQKSKEYIKSEKQKYQQLFIDIHFYFISWGNIKLMMRYLSQQPEFTSANIVFNSHRKTIEHYINARNTFEHFDERFPGGKKHDRVKEVQSRGASPRRIFKGLSKDGFYLHSDKQWDIKETSLEKLVEIVNEFLAKIHEAVDLSIEQKK